MNPYLVVTLLVAVTLAADWLLKLAALQPDPWRTVSFWAGACMYALTAVGWLLAMKHLSLASIGVYYSVLTILLLTFLGVFVFKEPISGREILGIALALASIALMTRFA